MPPKKIPDIIQQAKAKAKESSEAKDTRAKEAKEAKEVKQEVKAKAKEAKDAKQAEVVKQAREAKQEVKAKAQKEKAEESKVAKSAEKEDIKQRKIAESKQAQEKKASDDKDKRMHQLSQSVGKIKLVSAPTIKVPKHDPRIQAAIERARSRTLQGRLQQIASCRDEMEKTAKALANKESLSKVPAITASQLRQELAAQLDINQEEIPLAAQLLAHESNVQSSLLLFHQRSALTLHKVEDKDEQLDAIERSIVSAETKTRIIQEYSKKTLFSQKILTCAVCGERDLYTDESKMHYKRLSELNILKLTQPEMEKMDLIDIKYRPVKSVYPLTGNDRWHLHPEFVFVTPSPNPNFDVDYPSHSCSGLLILFL